MAKAPSRRGKSETIIEIIGERRYFKQLYRRVERQYKTRHLCRKHRQFGKYRRGDARYYCSGISGGRDRY